MPANQNLLDDLTDSQKEAVTHVDGPLLIIAGAGSGKTRVITRRVAYLISLGIPPASILAITFTNKAAGEMKERIAKAVARPMRDFGRLDQQWPTICTFHSLCLRILRHYAPQIGLPSNFSIFDSGDQNKLIKEAMKQLQIASTDFPPAAIHSVISKAKNQLQSPEAFSQANGDFRSRIASRVYTKYQELLTQNNALDFDDLLMRTTLSLRDYPQVLKELQDRFTYILIDEYQDTNHVQYVLAHALALRHKNICVVGDPDQSIYAWRGADIQNILDFEKDYPDAKVVKLEQNYRSTKTILHLASTLIGHNAQRRDKKLWTENAAGDKAKVFYAADEYEEANLVAAQLKELAEKHNYQWSQMAIFYRMNSLSRVMEDALRKENLPYVMARGVEFYNRKEIKDTLAYLRLIANPPDEVSLERIVNVPTRGIGDSSVKQMKAFAIATGISIWNAMERAGEVTGLSSRAINSTAAFVDLVTSWRTLAAQQKSEELEPGQKGPVQTLMEDVVRRSGLEAFYKKEGGDEQEERSNIDQLITSAAEFDHENATATLDEYLSMISLVSDIDHLKGNGGAITMMTLHAAKGLEFPVVAMIGLEEGCLPHARAREDGAQLEEERRLAFVGITRAQERLILTKSAHRTIRGMRERTIPSQFLTELPADAMEIEDRSGQSQSGWRAPQFTRTDTDIDAPPTTQFRLGQMVRHPTFGIGRIAEVTDAGQHTRAVVQFNQAGRKTLILQYARLEAVG